MPPREVGGPGEVVPLVSLEGVCGGELSSVPLDLESQKEIQAGLENPCVPVPPSAGGQVLW